LVGRIRNFFPYGNVSRLRVLVTAKPDVTEYRRHAASIGAMLFRHGKLHALSLYIAAL